MATVRYMVFDVEAAVAFYTTLLHFELVEQYAPAMAIVRRDELTLWLAGPPSSAARPMPDGRQPESGGWNRFVIEVDDLATTVERLQAAGVPFRNEIVTGPGGKQVLIEDPSGNAIELFQPVR
ncbi:MAG TPA: VOC family protein [Thermomicrobiales bacterium]|nr:VOC family protein [Thermomicrobiales bacterium]